MKKLGLLLGVVALLVPSLVLAGDIKIGLMCPLTGKWASEGQDMKNIVSLLVDETNAKGGINGSKVELVVEDDAGDPRTAALAAQKLASAAPLPRSSPSPNPTPPPSPVPRRRPSSGSGRSGCGRPWTPWTSPTAPSSSGTTGTGTS